MTVLVGVGALKRLTVEHGEVKSMHTAEAVRGRGVGSAMLDHLVAAAVARGMAWLSLETGAWPYFAPEQSHGDFGDHSDLHPGWTAG